MRVAHIIDSLGFGGAQTVVKGILESQNLNKDVFLYVLNKRKVEIKVNHPNSIQFESKSKFALLNLFKLKNNLIKNKIGVLHCHLFKSQFFGFLLKKFFLPEIKLIFHEHGKIFLSEQNKILDEIIYPFFLRLSKNEVNQYIAVSKIIKKKLVNKCSIKSNKIKVLYNFVDLTKFNKDKYIKIKKLLKIKLRLNNSDFIIGFAGRLVRRKGWEEYILSAKEATEEIPNLKFLIAGDGVDRIVLINRINSLNLNDKLQYLGYTSDMPSLYSVLDLVIVPSHWEPMGLIELEAQAMGVPIIASNVPALNEIIKNLDDGLLFEAKNYKDLAKKIIFIYKNSKIRKKIIKNGIKNAKLYSLNKYMDNLNKIYKGLK